MEDRASILCVGKDLDLLRTRSAVLDQAGYSAPTATVKQAKAAMTSNTFDLIVISADLSAEEQCGFLSAIGRPPILLLASFTFPADLLIGVKRLLVTREIG
jgi:DNA-binding response OmpR family regulator